MTVRSETPEKTVAGLPVRIDHGMLKTASSDEGMANAIRNPTRRELRFAQRVNIFIDSQSNTRVMRWRLERQRGVRGRYSERSDGDDPLTDRVLNQVRRGVKVKAFQNSGLVELGRPRRDL